MAHIIILTISALMLGCQQNQSSSPDGNNTKKTTATPGQSPGSDANASGTSKFNRSEYTYVGSCVSNSNSCRNAFFKSNANSGETSSQQKYCQETWVTTGCPNNIRGLPLVSGCRKKSGNDVYEDWSTDQNKTCSALGVEFESIGQFSQSWFQSSASGDTISNVGIAQLQSQGVRCEKSPDGLFGFIVKPITPNSFGSCPAGKELFRVAFGLAAEACNKLCGPSMNLVSSQTFNGAAFVTYSQQVCNGGIFTEFWLADTPNQLYTLKDVAQPPMAKTSSGSTTNLVSAVICR